MDVIEKPLVTIITVSYNSSNYIRDAIESVLAQSYQNIEYIIGDDCSTDGTWDIIQEYNDPRIKAYRNEKNIKEYPNRNKAIDLATGKYMIFIDGDDVIFSHGIAFFVSMMEAFPEAAMAIQKGYFNNMLYPALLRPEETICNHFYGKVDLLSSSFASNFFKTSILREYKLSTKYISGDNEVRLRIASAYPVLFVAGWVSWPRETPGQSSGKIKVQRIMIESYLYSTDIFENPEIVLNLKKELTDDIKLSIKKSIASFWLNLLRNGKLKAAKEVHSATGVSWRKLFQYSTYEPVFSDIISAHNSSHPFKKSFLKKVSGE